MHFLTNHLNDEIYAVWGRELLLFVCPSVLLAMCGDSFALTDSLTPVVAWFKCIWAVKRPCTHPDSLVGYLPPDRMSTRSSQQQHHYCVHKANSVSLPSSTSRCQLMAGESRQPLKWVMKHPGREKGSHLGPEELQFCRVYICHTCLIENSFCFFSLYIFIFIYFWPTRNTPV